MMKDAIATITPRFSSDRMVAEYTEGAYLPLLGSVGALDPAPASGAS